MDPKLHWQVMESHGFKGIAPCDIMDEEGEIKLQVNKGYHLRENIVGKNIKNYKSMLILSHFKGHAMAGFGGALKNISIGIASAAGKTSIHTGGKTTDRTKLFDNFAKQDDFLESMINYIGRENMAYINIANRLSVDCDCDSNPAEPEMGDIGIFGSTDPVAIDQASYDAVINCDDKGKYALIERMKSRNGIHTVEAAEKLGIGSRCYELIYME